MKNKTNYISFLILLSAFTLFGSLQISAQKISVESISSSQVPVKIMSSSAKITKEGLKINYSLFSYHTQELSSIKLFVFRVDETGRIKGGFAWNEEKIAVGSSKSNTFFFAGSFSKGERIVLIPIKARTQSVEGFAEARINVGDFGASIKTYLKNGVFPDATKATETTANFEPDVDPEGGTCDTAEIAVGVCGKGCVKSVDCKNQSFVCKDTCPSGSF
jgi:hypothetical protein